MKLIPVISTQRSMPMIKDHRFEDKKDLTPILTEDATSAKDCEKDI